MGDDLVRVAEQGVVLEFTFADMLRYSGPGSPGGVAHACRAMQRAFAGLADGNPVERSRITIRTSFPGPGARDAFELVTRAVTGDRYVIDASLARPDLGRTRERFVFCFAVGDTTATCVLRDGVVEEEFTELLATPHRSPVQAARLEVLKAEMADRIMSLAPDEVYDLA